MPKLFWWISSKLEKSRKTKMSSGIKMFYIWVAFYMFHSIYIYILPFFHKENSFIKRGGARHCSRAMVGASGLETCWRRSLEGFPGLRQETLGSLDLCRWPQGVSHGGSEKSGKLEVGGASRDSTGFGALDEGLISSWGRNRRVPLISDSDTEPPGEPLIHVISGLFS